MKTIINERSVSIEVKGLGEGWGGEEADYVRVQIARALGPYCSRIRSVTVRLTDLNGPRGGPADLECRVVVNGDFFPTVVVSERANTAAAAIDVAAERASRAISRALDRSLFAPRRWARG